MIAELRDPPADAEHSIEFVLIAGPNGLDARLHEGGVLGRFDALASPKTVNATLNCDIVPEDFLPVSKAAFEEKGLRVVAIFIPGDPRGAWVDPMVRVISDGQMHAELKTVLKKLNYTAE